MRESVSVRKVLEEPPGRIKERKKSQKNQEKGTIARVTKKKISYQNPRKRIVRKAEEKRPGQTEGRVQKKKKTRSRIN